MHFQSYWLQGHSMVVQSMVFRHPLHIRGQCPWGLQQGNKGTLSRGTPSRDTPHKGMCRVELRDMQFRELTIRETSVVSCL